MSEKVSWEDHLDRDGNRPEKALWSHMSTVALIDSVREREVLRRRREDHNVSCTVLFGSVQEDLLDKGFRFSISQIRNKWKKLKQRYYAKSDNPSDFHTWRYFDLMHEIMHRERRKMTKPRKIDAGLSLLAPQKDVVEMSVLSGACEADDERLVEKNNVIFRILEKKEEVCRTIQEESFVCQTVQENKDQFSQNDEDGVADHFDEKDNQFFRLVEDKDGVRNGDFESRTHPVIPAQEEHLPQHDGGVTMTMSALIRTIKEEHEKDRKAARENQQALIAALNNVASSIQNSSRELISALHSSLT